MASRRLAVVTAGLSQPSATRLLADRLAAATGRRLDAADVDHAVDVIELRDHAQSLANSLLTGFPAPGLRDAVERVVGADGLIAVTPIFNASYSGLFKLFFDVLERDSLSRMPVLIAATGGTPRHSLALEHAARPLFTYLGAAVVPTAVFAAAADWGRGDDPDGALVDRIDQAAAELAEWIAARARSDRPDPFVDPTPFEQLLGHTEAGDGATRRVDQGR